jgi:serine/threonine protein kinase
LADFGNAKRFFEEFEYDKMRIGTINWMAPEVLKKGQYSRYSDIWSLGCLIIEMITGFPPWT